MWCLKIIVVGLGIGYNSCPRASLIEQGGLAAFEENKMMTVFTAIDFGLIPCLNWARRERNLMKTNYGCKWVMSLTDYIPHQLYSVLFGATSTGPCVVCFNLEFATNLPCLGLWLQFDHDESVWLCYLTVWITCIMNQNWATFKKTRELGNRICCVCGTRACAA